METVSITLRDVPDDVHAELVRRAKQRGMSLQAYMRELLDDIAARASARARLREAADKGGSSGADDTTENRR